jgi:hypothetical protein
MSFNTHTVIHGKHKREREPEGYTQKVYTNTKDNRTNVT